MLSKTTHIYQGKKPACLAAAAVMATGGSLSEFEAVTGKSAPYNLKDVSCWLLSRGYGFTPGAYVKHAVTVEELPGVELRAVIDADLLAVLKDYAEQLGMNLDGAVNGLLHKALSMVGAKSRQGFRYIKHSGPNMAGFFSKSTGTVNYSIQSKQPAIVIVQGDTDSDHALYWDGAFLWDPAKQEHDNPVNTDSYQVFSWMPVSQFDENGNPAYMAGMINRES